MIINLVGQFFFFHNKISQAQNRLQRTEIKKYAQKTSKRKKLLIRLFAFCAFILLVLLIKTKSLNGLKKLVFMSLPVPLNQILFVQYQFRESTIILIFKWVLTNQFLFIQYFYWFSGTNISIAKTFFHFDVFKRIFLLLCFCLVVFLYFQCFWCFFMFVKSCCKKNKTALITSFILLLNFNNHNLF